MKLSQAKSLMLPRNGESLSITRMFNKARACRPVSPVEELIVLSGKIISLGSFSVKLRE